MKGENLLAITNRCFNEVSTKCNPNMNTVLRFKILIQQQTKLGCMLYLESFMSSGDNAVFWP